MSSLPPPTTNWRAGHAALAAPRPLETNPRRLRHHGDNGLVDYIAFAKYSRHRPDLDRRETYHEIVQRVEAMHRHFFHDRLEQRISGNVRDTPADPADYRLLFQEPSNVSLDGALTHAFAKVTSKRVLPSTRALQFGGDPILHNHARLHDCAFSPVDRVEFFREYFFLLLSGAGCGFSVQQHHVDRLPALPAQREENEIPSRDHVVSDSIEGWADALHLVFESFRDGFAVAFDFRQLRLREAPLQTAGGFAGGSPPLRRALADVSEVLRHAAGRRLRPIEVYDICLYIARAGRDAGMCPPPATICLFSADDQEMVNAEAGDWLKLNPQRAGANTVAVLSRTGDDSTLFRRLFKLQQNAGDPGFHFTDDPDYGYSPGGGAGLHPVLPEELDHETVNRLRTLGYAGETGPATRLSGWQICSLTTINGAAIRTTDDFFCACLHAAVIGTLQAAYTELRYLGPITQIINERDPQLGVSICGFMDNPGILFAPRILERGARICRAANQLVAAALGIQPSARVTCVQPEETAALLLGAIAGIHPRPAQHYSRRIQVPRSDPVYRAFHDLNPHMSMASLARPDTDGVIVFPVEAPAHAIVRDDLTAIEFMEWVRFVQQHWVQAGEALHPVSPGLHHMVSHSWGMREDEWQPAEDFIWDHRADFSAVSFNGDESLIRYPQMPVQPVVTESDESGWNQLVYHQVDYARPHPPGGG